MLKDSSPTTPKQQASIEQILKAGWYLLRLINEILDLAMIESGKMSLSLEPMALVDVIRECHTMIGPQARETGIRMNFPKFKKPYFVHADQTRVQQILLNLLSNAIKYNRADGVVDVTCRVVSKTRRIRISVRDTGEGLSAEKIAQLFQPFNRLGQEDGCEEGTGIGLVMSKRLIELMDGDIGVKSTVGVGTEVWFELNKADEPKFDGEATVDLTANQAVVHAGTAPRTLLYVEDNRANMLLVEQLIELRADLRLVGATDGPQGLAIAHSRQPEVILMDINLPGISGIEVLKNLRANRATAHIPVIALSANAMPRDIEKGLAAGFFRYLTKPIKVDEFMDTLDLALQHAETAAAQAGKTE